VAAQVTVAEEVVLTNLDTGSCPPRTVIAPPPSTPAGVTAFVDPSNVVVAPGETARFLVSTTAGDTARPGSYALAMQIVDAVSGLTVSSPVPFTLLPPGACAVRPSRELMVIDPAVVDDPARTAYPGPWSFGRLLERVSSQPAGAPAMVQRFFETWLADQTVNGFIVPARRSIRPTLLDPWPRDAAGALDLSRAPLRLLAIVNRMDLRGPQHGPAGEGRFVFEVLEPHGFPVPFTVILEYQLNAPDGSAVRAWAQNWHALSALPFPSESYKAALQRITDAFTTSGGVLRAVRTNEAALDPTWELRQFQPSPDGASLTPVPLDLTPDTGFILGSTVLGDFVNANHDEIMAGTYDVPLAFEGAPFRGGSAFNDLFAWSAPNIADPEARHLFSMNTCNGCHGTDETHTEFLHIGLRSAGTASSLSAFLQGIAIHDPFSGEPRVLNDLGRRKVDLESIVCGGGDPATGYDPQAAMRTH
jgi:hypothetical protein